MRVKSRRLRNSGGDDRLDYRARTDSLGGGGRCTVMVPAGPPSLVSSL